MGFATVRGVPVTVPVEALFVAVGVALLIGTLAGGGALAQLSRRFGEGLVNGALTARVGVAAIYAACLRLHQNRTLRLSERYPRLKVTILKENSRKP